MILDSGLVAKTPETIANVARLLDVEVADIRTARTEQGTRGYTAPRHVAVDGDFAGKPSPEKPSPTAGIQTLIDEGLSSTSPRVRKTAQKAADAVQRLRELVDTDKERQEAEAEVARLKRELEAAQARLRGRMPAPHVENRRSIPVPSASGPTPTAFRFLREASSRRTWSSSTSANGTRHEQGTASVIARRRSL